MAHLIDIQHLNTVFTVHGRERVLVSDVTLHVDNGETLCLVGESGSGKSLTMLSLLGLLQNNGHVQSGTIYFEGQSLQNQSERTLDHVRGSQISMIFQDALTSLNPVFTVKSQIEETLKAHLQLSKAERKIRMTDLLREVGLTDHALILKKYPHELSGGQRQRVLIAMALACRPKLLIADEPTTALDVTIQAEIMNLLDTLKKQLNMGLILITHDMGIVAQMADRVAVMYAGQIIEEASVDTLFFHPRHPYTRALLTSIPTLEPAAPCKLEPIRGVIPDNYDQLSGCRFAGRCAFVQPSCRTQPQLLRTVGAARVRCQLAEQLSEEVEP